LEVTVNSQKDELKHYAENSVDSQELQRKLSQSQNIEKQLKENDELVHKLEIDLSERNSKLEALIHENSNLVILSK
jgi:hypothetical protein